MESDEELKRRVDAAIGAAVRARGLPQPLEDAVLYAVLGPGKRTRPILCLRACEAVGGAWEAALPAAVAIEMVHAFSLVHDDLPAMDDDDLRRGRPTAHRAFREDLAILAGDGLQSLAAEALSAPGLDRRLPGELARATTDMIAGQVLDTVGGFPADATDDQRLRAIHRKKTAALLMAACRMGAICGGADGRTIAELSVYAVCLGICFQAVDDLLDVTADAAALGKATGKDADAGKLTYPGLYGVDGTRERIAGYRDEALAALAPLGPAADRLREMARTLAIRGA
ncbi:polyprenyl synthetase family protein [Phycisphaera mikurensis]|uniref:polyprenyl synthetase family protein n=1 Tax=Phycisphaera mikurensis TaxID=547188 RepID=UPI00059C03E3|nr:polyprenyl synthetase family protein [Phycisphaera mikurensis]MBB6442514.1 geranylgeranyl diphosphate synthase type II [Phycisphaera mikurensis]